ncbi:MULTISPECIES: alpha/beta hydrolase [Pseudonocardia]|uniref:Short chain dehydrogenase n=2 Tax=Pseudonocardia TaxID=1847 RepID=A0A1Y2MJW3_PSEAH|nr:MULTISPECIES: alpha/beta hydrolase [Pseudonocardia]OSY35555.1 short chain dehydrogenase [Pseudonocardia autotrophica]TDN76320.1 pimeloyl-ACP methyl ester carboxylesterase [Pseudonocardia autotrophica]BBG00304.1 hydrolase [Pseudonocardia autotrophica]GEC27505.1 hydrolase [Pseudonocardia saturnea]
MQHEVEVEPGVTVWVEDLPPVEGAAPAAPMLLVAGGDETGLGRWPDPLVDLLRARHRVIRYDHRDTGRSAHRFDEHPYRLADLADDALRVLDACGIDRVHAVGAALGGELVQLLALDHPDRLVSAALLATTALETAAPETAAPETADPYTAGPYTAGPEPAGPDTSALETAAPATADPDPDPADPADPAMPVPGPSAAALPGPSRDVLRMRQEVQDPRDERGELAWRVEFRRRLCGGVLPFDRAEHAALERAVLAHSGRIEPSTAHAAEADPVGLDRGAELGAITVPTLVVEAPEDPVYPPPHARSLAARIGRAARTVTIEGMGHLLPAVVHEPLAALLLDHAAGAGEPVTSQPTQR